MPAEAKCPECDGEVPLTGMLLIRGEMVQCPHCGVSLDLNQVDPPQLLLSPTDEEDWGE
jgi:lysine biosynthesis protein LysW